MTDGNIRVPEISELHDGREVDCEVITRNGANYYKQRTNAHSHFLDSQSGIYTPTKGAQDCIWTMDHLDAIAHGYVSGSYSFNSFGERSTSGAETNYAVWPNGVFSIPASTGVQMSYVGGAQDSPAGTNIRSVEVHGLRAGGIEYTEIITMNGATPVLSTITDTIFIQCLHVHTFGTSYFANANITASNGGITYSQISAGECRCTSSLRMVPAGKKLYIQGAIGSSISGTAAARTIIKFVASRLDTTQYNYPLILMPFASIGLQDGSESFNFPAQEPFSAGDIVGFMHTSDKACIVSASFFGRIEDA